MIQQVYPSFEKQQLPHGLSDSEVQKWISNQSSVKPQAPEDFKEFRIPLKGLVSFLIIISVTSFAMGIASLVDSSNNSKEIEDLKDEILALKISNSHLQKDIEQLKSDGSNDSSNTSEDNNSQTLDLYTIQKQIRNIQSDLLDLDTNMNQDLDKLSKDVQVLSKSFSDLQVQTGTAIDMVKSELQTVSKQVQSSTALGNKGVQIYGPFSPSVHSWSTIANASGLKTIDTTKLCQLKLSKKSLVTLIANMHAYSTNGASILAFQINRNVTLSSSGYINWKFGAGFINDYWHHVGYTQEYILDAGDYEVSVGVDTQSGQSGRITVNAFAFTAKVTEL